MQSSIFSKIIRRFRDVAGALPDCRTGKNTRFAMADIALSAFSVFFTQCPSFLSFQRAMEEARGRNNAAPCSRIEHQNGQCTHYHSAITPVIVSPGHKEVVPLRPEFIVPQDGHAKQDCEIAAAKRWLSTQGAHYATGKSPTRRIDYCVPRSERGARFSITSAR